MCYFPRKTTLGLLQFPHQNKLIVYNEPINNNLMLFTYHKGHAPPNPPVKKQSQTVLIMKNDVNKTLS